MEDAGERGEDVTEKAPQAEAKDRARAELVSDLLRASPADPSHILPPIAALREVVAVCESIEAGREAPGANDRRSLQADAQLALTALGGELRRHLQPTWADFFHGELQELQSLLDSGGGVSRLRVSAGGLIDRLRQPTAAQAAWRDLLTCDSGSVSIDEAGHWVALLREIDESLGHEWRWRADRLRSALLSESSSAAEEILGDPLVADAVVAWFVFADADLANDYLRVGQIQFFSSRVWPEALTDREFVSKLPESEFPDELDEEALKDWFRVRDNSSALVYARVELAGPRAEPLRMPQAHRRLAGVWARELVAAVVEAGSFRIGGTRWRLLEGESVFHRGSREGGGWSGTGEFQDPRVREEIRHFRNPLHERTGDALEELDPRMPDLIGEGSREAMAAVEEARWYEAARSQPDPAQRLVLHVRAFERALPVTRDFRWNDAVAHYLRDLWAVEEFNDELFNLAHTVHWELSRWASADLDRLEQWLVDEPRGGFTVTFGAFLRAANSAHSLLPRHQRLLRRRVKQVGSWVDDHEGVSRRLNEWLDRFSRLLNRALRQRNATVHGVTTVPEVVSSVDPFMARIAAFVVAQAIHSASEEEDLVDALERGRVRSRRMLWRLDQTDGAVSEILFKPEDLN